MNDLQNTVGGNISKIGLGPCMKNKWLKKNKDIIVRTDPSRIVEDETSLNLQHIAADSSSVKDDEIKNLKRRKLINQVVRKSYKIQKGSEYNPVRVKRIADLSKDMFGNKEEVCHILVALLAYLI